MDIVYIRLLGKTCLRNSKAESLPELICRRICLEKLPVKLCPRKLSASWLPLTQFLASNVSRKISGSVKVKSSIQCTEPQSQS